MLATIAPTPALHQRLKIAFVAALFALALGLGVASTAQQAGAYGTLPGPNTVCYQDPGLGKVCTKIKVVVAPAPPAR
ncbi:MAG: hypothetical protein M3008_07225 [Chloroflexota bacterium]|nr:hypothetical protein [Chloroflexota bacterium]